MNKLINDWLAMFPGDTWTGEGPSRWKSRAQGVEYAKSIALARWLDDKRRLKVAAFIEKWG